MISVEWGLSSRCTLELLPNRWNQSFNELTRWTDVQHDQTSSVDRRTAEMEFAARTYTHNRIKITTLFLNPSLSSCATGSGTWRIGSLVACCPFSPFSCVAACSCVRVADRLGRVYSVGSSPSSNPRMYHNRLRSLAVMIPMGAPVVDVGPMILSMMTRIRTRCVRHRTTGRRAHPSSSLIWAASHSCDSVSRQRHHPSTAQPWTRIRRLLMIVSKMTATMSLVCYFGPGK